MKNNFTKYHKAVNYLEKLAQDPMQYDYTRMGAKTPAVFLERTKYFLNLLNNPQKDFKYIHITGTSGKGSTTALLHEILNKAKFKVGSFTSPFCSTSIEKIRAGNLLIDPNEFAQLVEKIKPAVNKMKNNSPFGRPSYFECFLGIAFLYFKKKKRDWVILEVGLGGLFDATNAIDYSQISAITNIGLDHTHILGSTKEKIAKEKMGIIKPNSNFFTTETDKKLLKIFKKRCLSLKTKFYQIQTNNKILELAKQSQLQGKYQAKNIAISLAIAKHLKIKDSLAQEAVKKVFLPCRFEVIQKNPLVILDGAHNFDKIKSVIHNLKNLTYDKLYTIFACGQTKNAFQMLKLIDKASKEVTLTSFETHYNHAKADNPKNLSSLLKRKATIEANPQKAFKKTYKKLKSNDALLITGSFYLAGELRKNWITENKILKTKKLNST